MRLKLWTLFCGAACFFMVTHIAFLAVAWLMKILLFVCIDH